MKIMLHWRRNFNPFTGYLMRNCCAGHKDSINNFCQRANKWCNNKLESAWVRNMKNLRKKWRFYIEKEFLSPKFLITKFCLLANTRSETAGKRKAITLMSLSHKLPLSLSITQYYRVLWSIKASQIKLYSFSD